MAISGGDLANMRAGNQLVIPHLNVTPKVTVATMQINQTSFSYPIAQLTVDNVSMSGSLAFADIPVGSLVYIGTSAGAHDVTTSVIRKAPSGTTLFISVIGRGDPGYPQLEHALLANDQYITVLAVKPIWSLLSRINNQIFYKLYDVPYTDEGDDPDPVCNIGPWKRLALTGASVSQAFTNAAITDVKPASFAWGSKTISSYAWTTRNSSYALNTGAAFDGGISNTAGVTITFDTAGFYIVYCTITDSGGKTHTAETYVWVDDGTLALSGWFVESDTQDRQGRKMTIGIHGDTAESVVYPGAAILYTEEQYYNATTVTAGATVTTFAGYIKSEKTTRQVTHGRTLFEALAPSFMLDEIPQASQYIIEDTSPANWTEVSSDLTNASGIAWYLLQHHVPQMLQVFDFAPLAVPGTSTLDTTYRDRTWLFSGRTLWAQLSEIMKHQINIGCDSQGTLYLRHDPLLMDSTYRNAIDNRMTWAAGDIREELEYSRLIRMPVGIVDGYAFSWNGTNLTPYWSRSPSDAQGQGKSTNTANGMVVPTSTAQTRLNEITGHLFAKANSPTPRYTQKVMRNIDTADPARMVWHSLNISSTYDPRGIGYANQRALPEKVTRRWEKSQSGVWLKRIEITMQPETFGQAGLTKQIPVSQESGFGDFGDWFDPFEWGPIVTDFPSAYFSEPVADTVELCAINADGYIYTTLDFNTESVNGGPTWQRVDMGLTGTPLDFVVDPFSPGYLGTGDEINGWVITTHQIYKITDLFNAAPTVTSQHTFAVALTRGESGREIRASFGDFFGTGNAWVMASTYYSVNESIQGVRVISSQDGGATWGSEVIVSGFYDTSPLFYNREPALYLSPKTPGLAYTCAFPSTGFTPVSDGYKSTDWGATWARLSNPNVLPGDSLGDCLHVPYNDNDDEDIVYFGYAGADGVDRRVHIATGAVDTDIAPVGSDSNTYGMRSGGQFALHTYNNDRQYVLVCGSEKVPITDDRPRAVFVSADAGSSWTEIVAPSEVEPLPKAGVFSGNSRNNLYLWGSDGYISYSNNFGSTVDDRRGNIATDFLSIDEFLGIAGGAS